MRETFDQVQAPLRTRVEVPGDVLDAVDGALARALEGRVCVGLSVPAPGVDPVTLLAVRGSEGETAIVWEPPHGARVVGLGEAASVRVRGPGRIDDVHGWADALGARYEARGHGDVPPPALRFFGGFAFVPGGADEGAWAPFGDGAFVLPRFSYQRAAGRGVLTVHFDGGAAGAREDAPRVRAAFERLFASLLARPSLPPPTGSVPLTLDGTPRASWENLVLGAIDAIRERTVEKIVVAHRSTARVDGSLSLVDVLQRLRASYPECFSFAVRRESTAFVGATPERLVEKSGSHVVTEALAGSIATGGRGAPERLRASAKDREEHDVVVRHITERLGTVSSELSFPSEPGVRVLPNVMHLATPIHGTLRERTHVLDLVALLHPTPAVGGFPVEASVDWIRHHEPTPRGWYAGPVGWFEAGGDGEFAVALRSALWSGDQAWLYAGAGIVRDSNPDAEYDETALKLRAMVGALGNEP